MMTSMSRFTRAGRTLVTLEMLVVFALAGASTIVAGAGQAGTAGAQTIDPQLEQALLTEDWQKVVSLLDTIPEPAPAHLRLVKGHAFLALNKNNESLCLFLGASAEDLKQWGEWTAGFATRNPQAPIARYLRGDALARVQLWDRALLELNEALNIRANQALVLNARGVVHVAKGAWDEAVLDFDAATKVDPRLADAYASRGAMYIQRRDGAEGAARAFTTALHHSPTFVLALNGLGAVRVVLGDWDDAQTALADAEKQARGCLSGILEIVHLNAAALTSAEAEALSNLRARIAKANPGMEVSTAIKNMTPQQAARYMGALGGAISHNRWANSSLLMPSSVSVENKSAFDAGLVGNIPFAKANLSSSTTTTWRPLETTRTNLANQRANFAEIAAFHPNVQPERMSTFKSWWVSQIDPVGRALSHGPAGVSTEAIGSSRVDAGDWNAVTYYGLLYPVQSSSSSPR